MLPPLHATLTALQAFGRKLGMTANNIANVNTGGYGKLQAVFEEGRQGGVEVRERRIDPSGIRPGPPETGVSAAREASNVDLAEEIPALITTVYGFEANLKTVHVQDEVLGRLLDIVA
jgi:flagellar basal-body rod protein FlgC